MERNRDLQGQEPAKVEEAARLMCLLRSLDQLSVQRGALLQTFSNSLAGYLNISAVELDNLASSTPPERAPRSHPTSPAPALPALKRILPTNTTQQDARVTSTSIDPLVGTSRTAADDEIAVYCKVDGQEIQIGHLPTWVLQKSCQLTLRISPKKNLSAGIFSPPETDREAKTPEPQRLSRASNDLPTTEEIKPVENGEKEAAVSEERLVRVASALSSSTSTTNGVLLALPLLPANAVHHCMLDVAAHEGDRKVLFSSAKPSASREVQPNSSKELVSVKTQNTTIKEPLEKVPDALPHQDKRKETAAVEQPVAPATVQPKPEERLLVPKDAPTSSRSKEGNSKLEPFSVKLTSSLAGKASTEHKTEDCSVITTFGERPRCFGFKAEKLASLFISDDGSSSEEFHEVPSVHPTSWIPDRSDDQEYTDDECRSTSFLPVTPASKPDLPEVEIVDFPDEYSLDIEKGSIFDEQLIKTASGDQLNLQILALETGKPVIHAWVLPKTADSSMPEQVEIMTARVTSFYNLYDPRETFRPVPGQAVAVCLEDHTWTRGFVEERLCSGQLLVRLIDLGGHVSFPPFSNAVQPLHLQFTTQPAMIWRARISGFLPNKYNDRQAKVLEHLIVQKRMTAIVVALDSMPVVRLYDMHSEYKVPVEIPTVLVSHEQKIRGMHTKFGVIIHVQPTDEQYHFLLVDIKDFWLLETIHRMVQEETRIKLPIKPKDLVVAVPVGDSFCRAYVLDRSNRDLTGQVSIELADYGHSYRIDTTELYGLPDDVANRRTPSAMCCLEIPTDAPVEDWCHTRERLKSLEGSVVAYIMEKTLKRERMLVRIWDNYGQPFSVVRRSGEEGSVISAVAITYPECLRTGAIVEVIPRRFLKEFDCVETERITDAKTKDREMRDLSKELSLDTGEELAQPPALGVVVRVLSTSREWRRGITAAVDDGSPTVFLVFHLDYGMYEWTPLCNIRRLPTDLLYPEARAFPIVLQSVAMSYGSLHPRILLEADGKKLFGQKCKFEVTKVEDWYFRGILHCPSANSSAS